MSIPYKHSLTQHTLTHANSRTLCIHAFLPLLHTHTHTHAHTNTHTHTHTHTHTFLRCSMQCVWFLCSRRPLGRRYSSSGEQSGVNGNTQDKLHGRREREREMEREGGERERC